STIGTCLPIPPPCLSARYRGPWSGRLGTRERGGTGRRAGLRGRGPSGLGGSRPPARTGTGALLLLAPAEELALAALLLEVREDVGCGHVHDVLGLVEERRHVAACGLALRWLGRLPEAAVLPAGVPASLLELRAVVGAAPRGVRREVETALPDRLTARVRAALVVAAIGPHGHTPNVPERPSKSPRPVRLPGGSQESESGA